MSDHHQTPMDADRQTPEDGRGGDVDRRGFFRGAAALTLSSFAAPATFAQTAASASQAAGAPFAADAARALADQTSRSLRWAGRDPADWVRPRAGLDHNVVIVGGGQSGLWTVRALC